LIKWVVEFKSLSAKIAFASLSAALAFGSFLKTRFLNETIGITDSSQKTTAKTTQELFSAQEEASLVTLKPLSNSTNTSDSQYIAAGKVKAENLSFVDNIQNFAYDKVVNDQAEFGDVCAKTVVYRRSISDAFYATDDIDGTATALDDQELSFVKVKSNTLSLLDSTLFNLTKNILESYSIGDSGKVILQNYAEVTYFSDDYVGFAQSF
jgi:hypothetical protein